MRIPKRGEKGFTLIELLIVVAILGVLAAVIIPNVGRFLGRGEEEARRTEFHNVSSAVIAMMTDNDISEIPNPVVYDTLGTAQNDMGLVGGPTAATAGFPDYTTAIANKPVLGTETYTQDGYVLYNHQIGYDSDDDGTIDAVKLVNYVTMSKTTWYYTCEKDGTVRQFNLADLDHADIEEYTY